MTRTKRDPDEYLKMPYSRIVIPDEESGTFTAEILEFPGCIAQGNTAQEAYEQLELVAKSWIEASWECDQEIPPPATVYGYGGRFALRVPKSLHRQASIVAEKDGTSINQFIVTAIAEKIGAMNLYEELVDRLDQKFERHLQDNRTADNEKIKFIKDYKIDHIANNSGIAAYENIPASMPTEAN